MNKSLAFALFLAMFAVEQSIAVPVDYPELPPFLPYGDLNLDRIRPLYYGAVPLEIPQVPKAPEVPRLPEVPVVPEVPDIADLLRRIIFDQYQRLVADLEIPNFREWLGYPRYNASDDKSKLELPKFEGLEAGIGARLPLGFEAGAGAPTGAGAGAKADGRPGLELGADNPLRFGAGIPIGAGGRPGLELGANIPLRFGAGLPIGIGAGRPGLGLGLGLGGGAKVESGTETGSGAETGAAAGAGAGLGHLPAGLPGLAGLPIYGIPPWYSLGYYPGIQYGQYPIYPISLNIPSQKVEATTHAAPVVDVTTLKPEEHKDDAVVKEEVSEKVSEDRK